MRNYIKIICSALAIIMLCACSNAAKNEKPTTNITTSNIETTKNEGQRSYQTTTKAVAEPIASLEDYSKDKVIWGPGNIENHQQPADPLSLEKAFADLDGRWLLKDKKKICLTFDEGYENGFTPSILDTLKEKNVKAIFFVTYDFASTNPELIKRMINEGHIVGNHTYRHYTMDEVDDETAREEVTYLHDYIKKNFGYTMSYFRFPKGEFSQRSLAIVKELGYKSIFWSFAYADWDVNNPANENDAFQHICESTHDGEIMLLHAVSKTNADILPKVIDDIRQQGYEFTMDI